MVDTGYMENVLQHSGLIYIDTASLMNANELKLFVKNSGALLLDNNKHLIVSPAVCLELMRHLDSDCEEKRQKVLSAMSIMAEYPELFSIENQGINEEDMAKAFADAELLSRLTVNKACCGQLLITNDKKLGNDAMELNYLESCYGHKITVCYLNADGELIASKCIHRAHEPYKTLERRVPKNRTKDLEEEKTVSVKKTDEPAFDKRSNSWIMSYVAPIATFFAGIIFDKYAVPAIKKYQNSVSGR